MHGLKGKVREIVTNLNAQRNQGNSPRNISLRQYLAENYPDANGVGLTPGHLLSELDIDPQRTTVQELMSDADNAYLLPEFIRQGIARGMGLSQPPAPRSQSLTIVGQQNGGARYITPEVILDPISTGAVQGSYYRDLVVREEPVNNLAVTMPKIDLSDAAMVDSGEAATIEEGTITYESKTVKIRKRARGIGITYEAIMFNTISLVEVWFADLGRMLGAQLNRDAVNTIVDGDQDDGSEAAAVVGVADTGDGVTWYDIIRVAIHMGLLGRNTSQVIGGEAAALGWLNLPEVKNLVLGSPLMQTMVKSAVNLPRDLYISSAVGASKVVFNDPTASLVQLTAQALMVEFEKIVSKQLEKSYASIMTGFAKLNRNASVILDGSVAYSGHEFPSWMDSYQGA